MAGPAASTPNSSPEPSQDGPLGQDSGDPAACLDQQLVPDPVAEPVVHLLEAVEVDDKRLQRLAGRGQCLAGGGKMAAVADAGQRIALGELERRPFGPHHPPHRLPHLPVQTKRGEAGHQEGHSDHHPPEGQRLVGKLGRLPAEIADHPVVRGMDGN